MQGLLFYVSTPLGFVRDPETGDCDCDLSYAYPFQTFAEAERTAARLFNGIRFAILTNTVFVAGERTGRYQDQSSRPSARSGNRLKPDEGLTSLEELSDGVSHVGTRKIFRFGSVRSR